MVTTGVGNATLQYRMQHWPAFRALWARGRLQLLAIAFLWFVMDSRLGDSFVEALIRQLFEILF